MEQQLTQLRTLLRAIWKYRLYAVMVAWLIALAGWSFVVLMKDQYQSSARVYVDTQSVLQPLMKGLATPVNVDQQVDIMSRTLISRPNIERVIRMVDLDIKVTTPRQREELINSLAENITMRPAGMDNLYVIAYQHPDPKMARDVVQAFLSIFVEGSLEGKNDKVDSAVSFIDEQIKIYEQKLVDAETALKDFKLENQTALQGGDYASRLIAAEGQLNQAKLELKETLQARNALKAQLDRYVADSAAGKPSATMVTPPSETEQQLLSLRKNLDNLQLRFTPIHPDVIATKELISKLEARLQEEARGVKPALPSNERQQDQVLQQLKIALAESDAKAASIEARVAEYASRYNQLLSQNQALPEVEAKLVQLNRDYGINKSHYEELLQRRDTAKMSGDINNKTELVSFRIIDPPTLPIEPEGPNRLRALTMVLLLALIGGAVVAFLISQIKAAFYTPDSLRLLANRPLLGVVALVQSPQQAERSKRAVFVLVSAVLILLAVYAALAAKVLLTGKLL